MSKFFILSLVSLISSSQALAFLSVCDRSTEVQDAIVFAAHRENCQSVTEADLENILFLNLSQKKIKVLSASDFEGMTSLISLNLSTNSIASIPEGFFQSMKGLQDLNLSTNKISSLSEDTFEGLSHLRALNLSYNQLTALDRDLLSGRGLDLLGNVHFGNNQLVSVDPGAFQGLRSLETISMMSNKKLTHLAVETFSNLPALRAIVIYDNALDEENKAELRSTYLSQITIW